jgi:hypothetical protein
VKFVIKDNRDKQSLFSYLKELENDYIVSVKKQRNTRSNMQNSYYWKCIVQGLAEELGYFPNEMHDALRARFLSEYEMISYNDNQIAINKIGSTTALNTKSFEQYTEQIRVWALTDLGIRLMLPNEYE